MNFQQRFGFSLAQTPDACYETHLLSKVRPLQRLRQLESGWEAIWRLAADGWVYAPLGWGRKESAARFCSPAASAITAPNHDGSPMAVPAAGAILPRGPSSDVASARRLGASPRVCDRGSARRPSLSPPCRGNTPLGSSGNAPDPWSRHGQRDRRLHTPHGQAGLTPQRLGHVEVVPQPVRCIHHLRPGRVRSAQIGHQPWCQPHQLVRMQLQHPALLRRFLPHRCRRRTEVAGPAGSLQASAATTVSSRPSRRSGCRARGKCCRQQLRETETGAGCHKERKE
jgi:hypothetical protein